LVTDVDVYRRLCNTTGAVKLLTDPILDCCIATSGDIARGMPSGGLLTLKLGLFE